MPVAVAVRIPAVGAVAHRPSHRARRCGLASAIAPRPPSSTSVAPRPRLGLASPSAPPIVATRASNPDTALLTGADYVPSPMDTSILTSQLVVLGFTGVIVAYWWYVLVPGARVNLAVNKRSGRLRDYLEELKGDDNRKMERFFYQKWLAKVDPETRFLLRDDGNEDGDGRVVEAKTRLSDTEGVTRDAGDESLEDVIRKARRTPKFWSGDNPVLVGTALTVGAGVLVGALTGR